jgi:hypothetical protein
MADPKPLDPNKQKVDALNTRIKTLRNSLTTSTDPKAKLGLRGQINDLQGQILKVQQTKMGSKPATKKIGASVKARLKASSSVEVAGNNTALYAMCEGLYKAKELPFDENVFDEILKTLLMSYKPLGLKTVERELRTKRTKIDFLSKAAAMGNLQLVKLNATYSKLSNWTLSVIMNLVPTAKEVLELKGK